MIVSFSSPVIHVHGKFPVIRLYRQALPAMGGYILFGCKGDRIHHRRNIAPSVLILLLPAFVNEYSDTIYLTTDKINSSKFFAVNAILIRSSS